MARTRATCAYPTDRAQAHDHDACKDTPVHDELNGPQQAALREVLCRMPYLAGRTVGRVGTVAEVVELLDDLVELLRAAAAYHQQVTDDHNAMANDVAGMRRLLGLPT